MIAKAARKSCYVEFIPIIHKNPAILPIHEKRMNSNVAKTVESTTLVAMSGNSLNKNRNVWIYKLRIFVEMLKL